ncbi:hypothetical protein CGRA01v4_06066 [Colletotrichum graminicola]|uniref:Uncharacterized protein n=1 Tax=Colletotrichum graminicola (strain M1.001 / M2 / FGSC 10212) TaxID=645133 RepID=E3QXV3_COLGM|nr:uncharacterized protein GLRG_10846 [Colletotrichum graminicola M1.001]EFQ35691.1 hypothetical protein GLRG_10846 [Colletotrichum graminicola M1.001]WDK14785.1 hypothetical protein CGRA01v4_06066 [Colletotrichum graminicola]
MEVTVNHPPYPNDPKAPWIQFLDRESATEAAQQVDEYYHNSYLPSDPFSKFQADKGTAGFLNTLYELVFDLARVVPYDHDLQQLLVHFLVELVKLPTREVTIWNEKCLVYAKEPVFGSVMEDNWSGSYPSDMSSPDDPDVAESYKEWINLSAFLARCIQSGRNDCFENWSKYPRVDIPKGLEENHDEGPRGDCLQLVAVEYLLLAGEKLHDNMIGRHPDGSEKRQLGLRKWKIWAGKLQEIEEGLKADFDLVQAAKRARQLMVSLEPGI